MDTDPGWSVEGEWAFGIPQGGGNTRGVDPTSGFTGDNVYGYNLAGDYTDNMPEYHLTTTAMDCTRYENVRLNFRRWLGVEASGNDHAKIEVSNDGSTWTLVWEHTGVNLMDSTWIECEYDISAVADREDTVYIRWIMGPTDKSVTYPGWNIDDVYLLGDPLDNFSISPLEELNASGYEGGPFTPSDKTYTLYNSGLAPLSWNASVTRSWLSVQPDKSTLDGGESIPMQVYFTLDADSLPPGSYSDTVTFTNITSGFIQTRAVTLTVSTIPAEIEVTDSIFPSTDLRLPFGDVFIEMEPQAQITITNADPDFDLIIDELSLSTGNNGFRLESVPMLPVVISPLNNIIIDVVFTPTTVRDYQDSVIIQSNDEDETQVEVRLSGTGKIDTLHITPTEDFEFSGHPGGPFVPSNTFYHLTNNGSGDIDWTVQGPSWLDVSLFSGSLVPGESVSVKFWPNALAPNLPEGYYLGTLLFTNLTSTAEHKRMANLNVYTEPKIWFNPFLFDLTIPQGDSQTEILSIGNSGDAVLKFTLLSKHTDFTPLMGQETEGESIGIASGDQDSNLQMDNFPLGDETTYVPGELLVCFAPQANGVQTDTVQRNAVLAKLGRATIAREYQIVPGLCLVKLPAEMNVSQALAWFNQAEGILCAVPNYKVKGTTTIPDDTRFDELWGFHNRGQSGGTIDADIDAIEAWDISTGSDEIIVAVIDTGVDYNHPDLAVNMWVNEAEYDGTIGFDDDGNGFVDDIYGYDFLNEDGDPMDDHYHGTHVAGVIGAVGNNSEGVAGVCWNVRLMALKFLDKSANGSDADAIACIDYSILMGAKVLNNSWGRTGFSSPLLKAAIERAREAGVLFVASAGNNGDNNEIWPNYPSSYNTENIIAVMATDRNDERSIWYGDTSSNYGATTVDLSAPGSEILSCQSGGGYQSHSGTSAAAPHVSGAAALIWSVSPSLSYSAVKSIIMQTVDSLETLDGLCVSGGRLNVYHAMLETGAAWMDNEPQSGSIFPQEADDIKITFHADRPPGVYQGRINIYSNDPFSPFITIPTTMTVELVDYLTEIFDVADNDLSHQILTLVPDDSFNYYKVCRNYAVGFPVDPTGGTVLSLEDDDYKEIHITGETINFYGTNYDTFYVGSNGYVSFVSGDTFYVESLTEHFKYPRISALFDDLDPSPAGGGTVSWQQLDDRVVVTYEKVPEFHETGTNSFQIEIFFNGKIRITWLDINAEDGLAGLSKGEGLSAFFQESDLSEIILCFALGDLNADGKVDLLDYAVLASHWSLTDCRIQTDWCQGSDFDQDGEVGLLDLYLFVERWPFKYIR